MPIYDYSFSIFDARRLAIGRMAIGRLPISFIYLYFISDINLYEKFSLLILG